ncbi:MAG: hypothetical protein JWO94_396 [Verrucomicrobiaceae bacterium]|nr:hypothetical protein [Verrucomicrobiaceae bacterium]
MARASFLLLSFLLAAAFSKAAELTDDPVAPWTHDVKISQVAPREGRHTIHTYYLTNPESPDGTHVLFFASIHPAAYVGQVCMLDRTTGKETVLADDVHTEDAHRVACQQWLSGGRRVVFHEVVDKRWRVVVVDVETLAKTVIAQDHQLAFGRPDADLVPMYGCHWNPGPYRDLEVWDASTGQTRTVARIADVEAKYGEWIHKEFAGKPTSIFEPVLSPDLKRVFFKIAAGNGGDDYMSKAASHREGLVCYSLEKNEVTWQRGKWGHPAWLPDSRHIIEVGNVIYDSDGGPAVKIQGLPYLPGSHPSVSPDGRLTVTDGLAESAGAKTKDWGIVVGDMRGGKWALVHSFDQSQGAKSWRGNHPHPAFSADGRRIYFNVNDGPFTRLFVAEQTSH